MAFLSVCYYFHFPSLPFLSFPFGSVTSTMTLEPSTVPGTRGQPSDFLDGKEAVSQASPTDPPSPALHALKA